MVEKVVLYTTPMCAPCEQVKAYLNALEVDFEIIDVMMNEDAADLLDSKGIRSAPALSVGDKFAAGSALVPEKIDEMLGIA